MLPSETIKLEVNVPIRMRDGIVLYADIYRPNSDGRYPAILSRSPYGKSTYGKSGYMNPQPFARAGYAVVLQDCRGTGVSEGEYYPRRSDPGDGYDTVEWLAAQPWCNGAVGMYGLSYLGFTQWAAAVTQPPNLKAICPGATSVDACGVPFFRGGVFLMRLIPWYMMQVANALNKSRLPDKELAALRQLLNSLRNNLQEQYCFLPLKDLPAIRVAEALGMASFYSDFFRHLNDTDFWSQMCNPAPLEKVIVPAFHICGWYDHHIGGVLASYKKLKESGGSEPAKRNQKLLIGPWIHSPEQPSTAGELSFGYSSSGASINVGGGLIRWFDYWLKGTDNGFPGEPPVRIFVMGDNVWRDEQEWPLTRACYTKFFLHSNGRANSRLGGGVVTLGPPEEEQTDIFLYDPRNVPVETTEEGAHDQREVEERTDVLVYTSAPLEADLEVTGPIEMRLYASSSAVDTDFTGKLVDVWPDGRAYNLVDGIIRARYRESDSAPMFIEPGRVYEYRIDLNATSNVFKAGHRIRVQISSSHFPICDRNPNTGHPIGQDAEMQVAVQTIYHNREHPTHLILPIVPR